VTQAAKSVAGLRIVPLTPRLWPQFERLFGERGACGGCWCMTPRLKRSDYERGKGEANKRSMKKLVDSGQTTGVLALKSGRAVGWCSIEPRERILSLQRSRSFRPLDDRPVWSIVCLFIERSSRRQGLSGRLIEGAADHARRQGARIVEAYPVRPLRGTMPDVFAYPGPLTAYLRAGFRVVARPSPGRAIVRRDLSSSRPRRRNP